MKKLSDLVLISDIDGTLITYDGVLPDRNVNAINRFKSKGGRFGIATGRSKELTKEFVDMIGVNAPCVLFNGGVIYDFTSETYLYESFMPKDSRMYIDTIRQAFPDIPILIISNCDYYQTSTELKFASLPSARLKEIKLADIDDIPTPWYKVLFSVDEHLAGDFYKFVESQNFDGIRLINTNSTLVEMLPVNANKGEALKQLAKQGYISRDNIVAIGDYYNDAEMLEFASVSAVPVQAPDDIKAIADVVVCECSDGCVADFIEYLERSFEPA